MRREQQATLIEEYLARGGAIRRLPESKPTVASNIMNYMRDNNVHVQEVSGGSGIEARYVYKTQVVTLNTLLKIANRHRRRRRLPLFQLEETVH